MSFQFSIRWLLVLCVIVAVWAQLFTATPSTPLGIVALFFNFLIPAFCGVGLMRAKGLAKSFFLGMLVTTAPALFGFFAIMGTNAIFQRGRTLDWSFNIYSSSKQLQIVLVCWAIAPIIGLLCVAFHWLFFPPEKGSRN